MSGLEARGRRLAATATLTLGLASCSHDPAPTPREAAVDVMSGTSAEVASGAASGVAAEVAAEAAAEAADGAEGAVTTISEHPDYPLIKAYRDGNAARLMRAYGAHALGIRWKTRDGERTDRPALALYIDPAAADAGSVEPVPEWLEYRPAPDRPAVRIPTEVVTSEQASPE